jgi:small subunit ribosomal protein S15
MLSVISSASCATIRKAAAINRLSSAALPATSVLSNLTVSLNAGEQKRFRWTKAKKKRFARFERRQQLVQQGIPLTKPPYYFAKNTPVANADDKQHLLLEAREMDEKYSKEIASKFQEQRSRPPVLRHHMMGMIMSDRVRKLFDLQNGNQKEVVQAQKQLGMELFQMRPGDTGSSAVQVVALTTRIQQIQTHLIKHKKDKHSKRGLDALYVRRRKLLDYMERKDFTSYRQVVKTLGLTRKA